MLFEPNLVLSPLASCLFGLAAIILGVKSYDSYRLTRNPLGLSSMVFGVALGAALIIIGLPFLLTSHEGILLAADYLAVIGIQIACIALVHLLWFSVLRNVVRFRYLVIGLVVWGLAILASDVATLSIVSREGELTYQSSALSLWLKASLYVVVGWPLAAFYMRQALRQAGMVTKLKLGGLSLVVFLASTSAVLENITSSGQASHDGAIARLTLAIATLLFALWPRQAKTTVAGLDPAPQPASPSTYPAQADYTAEHPDKTSSPSQTHS